MKTFRATCRTCGFGVFAEVEGRDTNDAEMLESQGVDDLSKHYAECPACRRELRVEINGAEVSEGDPQAGPGRVTTLKG